MTTETCANCRYVFPAEIKEGQHRACRRFPPQTHFLMVPRKSVAAGGIFPAEEQRSAYPTVNSDWTCGEFAPRIALTS